MLKTISLNLLITILILLFFELFLRLFNIVELQGYDKDSFYKEGNITLHKPNFVSKVMGKKLKTDENGFRIPLSEYVFQSNLESILILGDSVSYGVSVDENKTFVGLLRKKINKNLFNASVTGHTLKNYSYLIKRYKNTLSTFEEAVIFLCLNDIMVNEGVVKKENFKKISHRENENLLIKLLRNDVILKVNLFLREKSTLFNLVKGIGTKTVERYYNYITPYYDNKVYLEEYKNDITDILIFSKKNKIGVKFVLMPYKYQLKNNCDKKLMKPQNEIKKIFKSLNFELFDLSQDFCESSFKNDLILNFDPMHLSEKGHKFVSNLIIEKEIIK